MTCKRHPDPVTMAFHELGVAHAPGLLMNFKKLSALTSDVPALRAPVASFIYGQISFSG